MEAYWPVLLVAVVIALMLRRDFRNVSPSAQGQGQGSGKRGKYVGYVVDLTVNLSFDDLKTRFMEPFIKAIAHKGVPVGHDAECHLFGRLDDSGTVHRVEVLDDGEEPSGGCIDFWAFEASDEFEALCVQVLESLGAPKGSLLVAPDLQRSTALGVNEGMAVYIDTVGLPKRVYEKCSVGVVLKELPGFLGDSGELFSHWEGPKETALYCYGPSYQAMADAIAPFIARYALLEGCRIEQIA